MAFAKKIVGFVGSTFGMTGLLRSMPTYDRFQPTSSLNVSIHVSRKVGSLSRHYWVEDINPVRAYVATDKEHCCSLRPCRYSGFNSFQISSQAASLPVRPQFLYAKMIPIKGSSHLHHPVLDTRTSFYKLLGQVISSIVKFQNRFVACQQGIAAVLTSWHLQTSFSVFGTEGR